MANKYLMKIVAKLVAGIILLSAGILWYVYNYPLFGETPKHSLVVIFNGLFGLVLFLSGLILAVLQISEFKARKARGKKR